MALLISEKVSTLKALTELKRRNLILKQKSQLLTNETKMIHFSNRCKSLSHRLGRIYITG